MKNFRLVSEDDRENDTHIHLIINEIKITLTNEIDSLRKQLEELRKHVNVNITRIDGKDLE